MQSINLKGNAPIGQAPSPNNLFVTALYNTL
jgi:hypothetical protein